MFWSRGSLPLQGAQVIAFLLLCYALLNEMPLESESERLAPVSALDDGESLAHLQVFFICSAVLLPLVPGGWSRAPPGKVLQEGCEWFFTKYFFIM